MEKPCIILLGAPGSGKGTRAGALCEILGIPQIATGDLFRENLKAMTPIGKIAKVYIDKGELVPDQITADMLKNKLEETKPEGFILDGFPRTIAQAQILDPMLEKLGRKIDAVIYIDVADEEIVTRLSGRMICASCQAPYHIASKPPRIECVCDKCGGNLVRRDDDNPDTIRKRLVVFHNQTFPLTEFYEKRGMLTKIPSHISVSGLFADMRELSTRLGFIK